MTMQLMDTLRWKGKTYDLVTLRGDLLIGPWDYGINPKHIMTCCWNGFTAGYVVRYKRLYIESWDIHATEDGNYPAVNGVDPDFLGGNTFGQSECIPAAFTVLGGGVGALYRKLMIPMNISSDFIIGKGFVMKDPLWPAMPDNYTITYELSFKDGVLVDAKDTSGTYGDWFNMHWHPDEDEEDEPSSLSENAPDDDNSLSPEEKAPAGVNAKPKPGCEVFHEKSGKDEVTDAHEQRRTFITLFGKPESKDI